MKIVGKRNAKKAVMYKVIVKDLSEKWYIIDKIGSDYSRLLNDYEALVKKQKN